jgi:tRNA A37 threonylcarbamoyladenosine synthetase subunit TsaC/SUA5/YrdC
VAFALQISQNHGLQQLPHYVRALASASANICYAPAAARGQRVLPDFIRSETYLSEPEFMEFKN